MKTAAKTDRVTGLGAARRAFHEARFSDAARQLDELIERGASPGTADALLLRARITLKKEPAAALSFLAHHESSLRGAALRGEAQLLAGVCFARLGDPVAAVAKLASAAPLVAGEERLERELAYCRAQVAWIERDLERATQELDALGHEIEGDLALETAVLRGAIASARGNVIEQGAILLNALRAVHGRADPGVLPWAVIASQLAYLARELPGASLRDAAYGEVDRIPWTSDLGAIQFTMVRAIAWRRALDGDYFNAFRNLKAAKALAPTAGWKVTASCDRAYLASVLNERRWAEQETSDAEELASRVDWRTLDGEECFALLVLAELLAPRDASLALSYVARYKEAGTRFSATLSSRDDRRVDAQEAYAFGIVQLALGDRNEAVRLLRESFAVYDAIGYDWRAGRAALALAQATRDDAWRLRARTKLAAYPSSWLELPQEHREMPVAGSDVRLLTVAQRGVYEALLRGLTPSQIASEQKRSEFTVRNHVKAIFKAFGVNSRAALMARASGRAD